MWALTRISWPKAKGYRGEAEWHLTRSQPSFPSLESDCPLSHAWKRRMYRWNERVGEIQPGAAAPLPSG